MTEQELREGIKEIVDQLTWLGDLVMDEDAVKATDEIMALVAQYIAELPPMQVISLPLPAGYQTQPSGTAYTRPMRNNL